LQRIGEKSDVHHGTITTASAKRAIEDRNLNAVRASRIADETTNLGSLAGVKSIFATTPSWSPPATYSWKQTDSFGESSLCSSTLTTASARKALYAPATALEKESDKYLPKSFRQPASIRHVVTDYAIRTGRKTAPTFEDTLGVAIEGNAAVESLVESREHLRYSDYLTMESRRKPKPSQNSLHVSLRPIA
jgi:hypothetical protein